MHKDDDFDPEAPLAAAIVDDRSLDMDAFLTAIVRRQQALGLRLRGFLMKRPPRENGCAATMVLVDVNDASEYLVSQPLGSGSRGCRADPAAFARASQVLREALEQAPDLIVSNRFGDLELRRGGFSAELLAAMEHGIPLLTTVAQRNAEAWQQFSGAGRLLPPDEAAVSAWLAAAIALSRASS
ncbi:DUF2478 domain-containing protein [Roseateles violae]|uniref:DUF2478 domain-containing protein n=1 Tax=Roseateles violae TaxID=3058042 RepID=A0ABT8DR13_9BURK|nr:DUF2478 domain-containing protein [Pelomonas sp. PFR6]MDN3918719.1 DUF2478 domain-containing protein [Pelomonas sp. PFR6]